MKKESQFDVLAERYASQAMLNIWSSRNKIVYERQLWLAAIKAQAELGLPVSYDAIQAYKKAIHVIDFNSIAEREVKTRHDVKARIEEFNAVASQFAGVALELIHQGFTSRDLTENVEQLQILNALKLVREKSVSVLSRFIGRAFESKFLVICGRSHNVPAQAIILGKRFTNWAEEMLIAFDRLEYLISHYPLRGIKGPTGTQQDMVDLLGNKEKASAFEKKIQEHLGFASILDSVGQVYPRSLDFEVVSVLLQLASASGNFAKMIRLMAGSELAHEGFGKDQIGSSGMPHKMNSRTCERVNGLILVLGGFQEMTRGLLGDQWFEGDVSCSVVRRVALQGSFFAIDGLFESVLTILDEMEIFPAMIEKELDHYLPFLSTTRILTAVLKKGMGRETAHKIIKKYALDAIKDIRSGGSTTFVEGLSGDKDFLLSRAEIEEIISNPNYGLAQEQIGKVYIKFIRIALRFPTAASYNPEPIL